MVIAGDGPERRRLEDQAAGVAGITFLGRIGSDRVSDLYSTARAVALPSICFEQFPRGVVEAFSHARPLVVSDIGGVGELVEHGVHGRKFPPKDAAALADDLKLLLVNGKMADRLGQAARQEYLQKYTAEINFRALTKIYEAAVESRRSGSRSFAFIPA